MTRLQQNKPEGGRLPVNAMLMLVLLCFLWGGNAVSVKFSNLGLPPLLTAVLRSVIAGALVWGYARLKGRKVGFPPGYRGHAWLIGCLFGLEFILFYWGLALTTASRAVIFFNTLPFWVALGAHFLLRDDRLNITKVIGLVLAFSGVVIVLRDHSDELPAGYWVGDLMELGGAFFWASVTLMIKRVSQKVELHYFQTLYAQLVYAIPVLALGVILFELPLELDLGFAPLAALFYQSVVVAFASYLVWFWMIHRYMVSRMAAFTFMSPLFGVILGGAVLDEPVTSMIWLGLLCVSAGVYLVNR